MITTDGLDLRVAEAVDDSGTLVELCLPAAQLMLPLGALGDHDATAYRGAALAAAMRVGFSTSSNVGEPWVSTRL